ncbi:hypothetical protein DFR70_102199 [Nocardia tenerifensis]|uniref:Uncharacterized protein n=1 Tax=Nocardia tenerifensis TaxID=228006 RepID=A0A318K5A3_9NOCA|nr:hypothetical protein DFR70_102199 [Nocardia tenerifensis]
MSWGFVEELFACRATHVATAGAVAEGAGGGGVEGVEVVEGGVFVVYLEEGGAAAEGAGGVAVHGGAGGVGVPVGGLVAELFGAAEAGGAAAADVLFDADLLAQVGEVGDEDDGGEAAAPPEVG